MKIIIMEMKLVSKQLMLMCLVLLPLIDGLPLNQATPKLAEPAMLIHDPQDVMLNSLDDALQKISTIYTQALLAGTHTPELDISLRTLEMELFELLDQLYKQHRLQDYMKYEAEVTRQMLIYNMVKRLFGYTQDSESEN